MAVEDRRGGDENRRGGAETSDDEVPSQGPTEEHNTAPGSKGRKNSVTARKLKASEAHMREPLPDGDREASPEHDLRWGETGGKGVRAGLGEDEVKP